MTGPTKCELFPDLGRNGAADLSTTATPVVVQRYVRFHNGAARLVDEVIAEMRLRIVVNGVELVDLMCSPHRVNALVLGFLFHEGVIDGLDDVDALRVCLPDGVAEVRLSRPNTGPPHSEDRDLRLHGWCQFRGVPG